MATKKKKAGAGDTVRKLTKTGNYTYYVTIPKTDIEALGWKERQRLKVRRSGQKIIIENVPGRR